MHSPMARAIREARLTLRLTQAQLAQEIGLRAHAVYRWEAGYNIPKRTTQRSLLEAVARRNPQAATQLTAAFASQSARAGVASVAPPPAPAPAQPTGALALELAIFEMADELDLAPRRLRAALPKLLLQMHAAGYALESARQEIETRNAAPR